MTDAPPPREVVSSRPVVVLAPRRGWRGLGLHELWGWRELMWALVWRDIRSRYRQAALGVLWALIRPVFTMAIFAFVLGRLARVGTGDQPYALFAYAGLLAWGFFGSAVQTASLSVVGASNLVTKVYFPRLLLPLSAIGAATVDFLIAVLVLVPLMIHYGVTPTWRVAVAPLVMVWVALASAGIGILLSGLVVRYRDFGHAMAFLMQLWMYATPVLYPLSLLPEGLRVWVYLNPMTGPVEAFRWCILGTELSTAGCAVSAATTLLGLCVGLLVFQRVERHFADVI
ncbi:MAG: ABC transporter permease [Planctomycetes bacterium]|nr:ABC transporter permease [Planctomycetota bacterium]